jgi:hypothetical protein
MQVAVSRTADDEYCTENYDGIKKIKYLYIIKIL